MLASKSIHLPLTIMTVFSIHSPHSMGYDIVSRKFETDLDARYNPPEPSSSTSHLIYWQRPSKTETRYIGLGNAQNTYNLDGGSAAACVLQ